LKDRVGLDVRDPLPDLHKPILLTGSAAKGIAKRLERHGYRLLAGPECFLVSTSNRLLEGEIDHATTWGADLVRLDTAAAAL
jgi:hypothetical protein